MGVKKWSNCIFVGECEEYNKVSKKNPINHTKQIKNMKKV